MKNIVFKTGEATGDLICNKIANKISSVQKNLQLAHKIMKQMMRSRNTKRKIHISRKKDNKLLMN